ncbi:MAG TPA: sugar transferase [Armatimonadota bacterium]|nr:sugar transferase [Armatimonadota bacterium]
MNETRGSSWGSAWVVGVIVAGAALLAAAPPIQQHLGTLALVNVMVAVVGVGASTGVARWWMASRTVDRAKRRDRALIVGVGPVAQHLARQAEWEGCEVLGYLQPETGERLPGALGCIGEAADLARELRADRLLVTESTAVAWALHEQVLDQALPTEVFVVPDGYELAIWRPSSRRVGDVPLYRLPRPRVDGQDAFVKRVFDITISALLLVLLAPVMLVAMLAVRCGSRGPALFRQERVGRNGRRFQMVKLRTMVADAEKEGPQLCAGKRDPRLTPVGRFLRKTHLDEVPQLGNVLRGEMSLVGPRPERPCFVEQFERDLPRYRERHRIQPGITGLAQINGYYHSTPREKLRYDLMYLYHRSLWMDLYVLVRTLLSAFGG